MNPKLHNLFLLSCVVFYVGCATKTYKYIYVESDPPGADVYFYNKGKNINEGWSFLGNTSSEMKYWWRGDEREVKNWRAKIKIALEGYEPIIKTFPMTKPPEKIHVEFTKGVSHTPTQTKIISNSNIPEPQIKSAYSKMPGKRWTVIVGISNYRDSRIPSLRYASADAQAFHDWAVSPDGGKYAPARVKLLIGKDATGRNIKNALFVWLKQAIEEDMITIYFAGHGSPESPDSPDNLFLLPYDTEYGQIATTGFPMWDIETALKRFIKAKKVVVIADACHAGGVGQAFDVARRANRGIEVNPISAGLQNLSKIGDGICVISASDDKQLSQEGKAWGGGHGVFTYFLLKGLKGEADYNQDSRVTLGELIPFLSEQVRRETKNAQSPTVAGKFDPALSIEK